MLADSLPNLNSKDQRSKKRLLEDLFFPIQTLPDCSEIWSWGMIADDTSRVWFDERMSRETKRGCGAVESCILARAQLQAIACNLQLLDSGSVSWGLRCG